MDESVSEWELSKENIQPLRQGRKVDHLQTSAQLTADDKLHEKELEAIKRQFETELRTYSGEDPLDVWYEYIKWVEQHFPKGGREGNLNDLVQKCLAVFKDNQQYVNDPRYLEIWLKCINSVGDPLEIYQYLYSNNFFCELAEFYIQWALQLEQEGHHSRADKVYSNGITKNAQPIQNLNTFYRQFLARVTKQAPDPDMVTDEDNRIALAELEQQRRGRVLNIRKGTAKSIQLQQQPQQRNTSTNFQIYCDGSSSSSSQLPAKVKESSEPPISNDVIKENSQKPRKWCNAKVSQKSDVPIAGGHFSQQNFDIHQDNNATQSTAAPRTICVGTNAVLSDKKVQASNITSELQNKPKYSENVMYCKDKIYRGTEEFSFEEIRAVRWRKKQEAVKEKLLFQEKLLKAQQEMLNEWQKKLENEFLQKIVEKLSTCFADQSLTPSQKMEAIETSKIALKSFVEANRENVEVMNEDQPTSSHVVNTVQLSNKDKPQDENKFQSSPVIVKKPSFNDQHQDEKKSPPLMTTKKPSEDKQQNGEKTKSSFINAPKLSVEEKHQVSVASPTVNTKLVLKDVYNMFSKSLQFDSTDKLLESTIGSHSGQNVEFPIFDDQALVPKTDEISPEAVDSENKENLLCPPIQEKRPLAGILQPSTNVYFVPLEEQENMLNLEDQINFEDIEPIPTMDRDDMTFAPPRNEAMFAALLACGSSTPFPSKMIQNTPCLEEKNESETLRSAAKCSQPETSKLSKISTPILAVHEDTYAKASLSAITEISNECYSSKSSSGSCPSTGGLSTASNQMSEKSRSLNTGKDKYLPSVSSLVEEDCSKMDQTQDFDPFCAHLINGFLFKNKDKILNRPGFIFKSTEKLPSIHKSAKISLGIEEYLIEKLEGEGAYAKIYRTRRRNIKGTVMPKIFKVQQPPCPWEYYITSELHERLQRAHFKTDIISAIVQFNPACIFSDGSILVCEFLPYGTLLDMVNLYKKQNKSMPETLVIYFTIELLHILEQMHSCKIIHGDFKPDNIMIKESKPSLKAHFTDPEDMFPKEVVTLQVIDFGRSIDMLLFDEDTVFTTQVETDGFKCTEMKENKAWTYQIDHFGLAATVHCMLFNDYMKTEKKNGVWTITEHIKRYWQAGLWKKFFHTLLNIPDCNQQPDLAELRKEFQATFAERYKPSEFYTKHRQLCNFLEDNKH